jgi:hypothetical protein
MARDGDGGQVQDKVVYIEWNGREVANEGVIIHAFPQGILLLEFCLARDRVLHGVLDVT